ncbi:hypothetical protein GPJ56_003832 [Histomonas meleagridis]|uniref:uncharacterized protein n=1 Tax=Histomonas meleagridis TaxID=135588 RepID=UPI003559F7D4|nr:hypothetical protein GPJ56_003832 [Histomonas meleagridis]KAH0805290.1 hypothetical protein GO595_002235 [Histomonas meleagridis]
MEEDQPIPDSFSLDSLVLTRQKEQELNEFDTPEESNQQEENHEDEKLFQEFQEGIKTPPFSSFPHQVFDLLANQFERVPIVFPRLTKWLFCALDSLPARKIMASETVLFTLLQEMLLSPQQHHILGPITHRYGTRLPDYSISLPLYLEFLFESALTCHDTLVYFISFLHPQVFQEEFTNPRCAHSDIVLLILSSLFCNEVRESSHIIHVIDSLKSYLNEIPPDELTKVIENLCKILPYDHPELIFPFISNIPLDGSGVVIVHSICYNVIANYLSTNISSADELISSIPNLKKLCDSSDKKDNAKADVVIYLLEKLCISSIKMNNMSVQQIEEIGKQLRFPIAHEYGTFVELKEHLFVTSKQIELLCAFVEKKSE